MQRIIPHLWYDGAGEAAFRRYVDLVPDSELGTVTRYPGVGQDVHGQSEGAAMTVEAVIGGRRMMALNGGPHFRFTPASSLFATLPTADAVDRLWQGLSENGSTLMPLESYEWSPRFGWLEDEWGLSWQIAVGDPDRNGGTVVPALMFGNARAGTAEAAIQHYCAILPGSRIDAVDRHDGSGMDPEGTVKLARFTLAGDGFLAMDSAWPHAFDFNEALSLMVPCEDQDQIDRLWAALSAEPAAERCGWLKDRFGVSWQIVPGILGRILASGSADQRNRVMQAFLGMGKIDLAALQRAQAGEGGG